MYSSCLYTRLVVQGSLGLEPSRWALGARARSIQYHTFPHQPKVPLRCFVLYGEDFSLPQEKIKKKTLVKKKLEIFHLLFLPLGSILTKDKMAPNCT